MKKVFLLGMITLVILFSGCARVEVYTANPTLRTVSNAYFDAEFEPQLADGNHYFDSFRLVIENKTDKPLILDWSQCNYLYQGKRKGLFGWEDMTFKQLREARDHPQVTIKAGATLSEVVFPLDLIGWDLYAEKNVPRKTKEDAFHLGVIPAGMNGIQIYVTQDGKVVKEKIMVNITMEVLNK
ncbi:hypothetical protein ACFL4N_00950 [Thermodesulfobacteriota bacterium]